MTGRAPDDLAALIARVEAATGPVRELDALIWRALEPADYRKSVGSASGLRPKGSDYETWERTWTKLVALPFTASLDAALALVDRVLPEANCCGFDGTPFGADAYVSRNCVASGHWFYEASGKTPALALILALLRALQAQPHRHNARDGAARTNNELSHDR